MYHLPLLPGYGPHANIRSSASPSSEDDAGDGGVGAGGLSEVEEDAGFQGPYSDAETGVTPLSNIVLEGYITSASESRPPDAEVKNRKEKGSGRGTPPKKRDQFVEAVFFAYGVAVFFGFTEEQERGILEDVEGAGALKDKLKEDEWEIEQCHYAVRVPQNELHYTITQKTDLQSTIGLARSIYLVSESIQ